MSLIRSKARRAAWKNNGKSPNYNPFARTRASDKRRDEETHLEPPIEEQQRLESRQTVKSFPTPQPVDTAPSLPGPTQKLHSLLGSEENFLEEVLASSLKESEEALPNALGVVRVPNGLRRQQFANIGADSAANTVTNAITNTVTDTTTNTTTKTARSNNIESEGSEHVDTKEPSRLVRIRVRQDLKISIVFQLRAVFLSTWINILLPIIPAGFVVYYTH
ncbi:hypothetical protein AOQ84DRAFT_358492 [Glonium stellatum]|uniref:Uncharacterized protein n=1 Tax=Glonium stellatum TaxID=574774 RepID=A0A8E2FD01_9PEZI|nr:hypothetical protein AOQ84DRAFT_358492 [Glonium stellatum]